MNKMIDFLTHGGESSLYIHGFRGNIPCPFNSIYNKIFLYNMRYIMKDIVNKR